jgi:hypothetical protein
MNDTAALEAIGDYRRVHASNANKYCGAAAQTAAEDAMHNYCISYSASAAQAVSKTLERVQADSDGASRDIRRRMTSVGHEEVADLGVACVMVNRSSGVASTVTVGFGRGEMVVHNSTVAADRSGNRSELMSLQWWQIVRQKRLVCEQLLQSSPALVAVCNAVGKTRRLQEVADDSLRQESGNRTASTTQRGKPRVRVERRLERVGAAISNAGEDLVERQVETNVRKLEASSENTAWKSKIGAAEWLNSRPLGAACGYKSHGTCIDFNCVGKKGRGEKSVCSKFEEPRGEGMACRKDQHCSGRLKCERSHKTLMLKPLFVCVKDSADADAAPVPASAVGALRGMDDVGPLCAPHCAPLYSSMGGDAVSLSQDISIAAEVASCCSIADPNAVNSSNSFKVTQNGVVSLSFECATDSVIRTFLDVHKAVCPFDYLVAQPTLVRRGGFKTRDKTALASPTSRRLESDSSASTNELFEWCMASANITKLFSPSASARGSSACIDVTSPGIGAAEASFANSSDGALSYARNALLVDFLNALNAEGKCPVPPPCESVWDYLAAATYSGTIFSTIGYGSIGITTTGGKAFVVTYALFGFGLFGYAIALIVQRYSRWLNSIVMAEAIGKRKSCLSNRLEYVRISSGVLLMYWLLGGIFFYLTERDRGWTVIDALYFCFVSITTIGFGDYTPNFHDKAAIMFQMLYILFGIALFQLALNIIVLYLQVSLWAFTRGFGRVVRRAHLPHGSNFHRGHGHGVARYVLLLRIYKPTSWAFTQCLISAGTTWRG